VCSSDLFLRGPIPIRPWLTLKMPTFGMQDPELNGIIRYFGAVSNTIGPFRTPQVVRTAASDQAGKVMFELLKCQQCHVLGTIPKDQPTANLAPDLRMAPDRLQPDWIVEWLKNPASIVPGTRMPGFWPDYPKSFYPHAGGGGEAQINAIVGYLQGFKGGPTPRVSGANAPKAAND
jgi:mono/diheme cytochrome c family protein